MTAKLALECQFLVHDHVPTQHEFEIWVQAALPDLGAGFAVSIRVVGAEESRVLNREYRGKDAPTNVLSFALGVADETGRKHLGDIVICEPIVVAESLKQGKLKTAHWAHLTVHGVLHLLGFDHESDQEACEMEALEVEILAGLGYQDPYELKDGG